MSRLLLWYDCCIYLASKIQRSRLFSVTWGGGFCLFLKMLSNTSKFTKYHKWGRWLLVSGIQGKKEGVWEEITSPSIILWVNSRNRPRNRQGVRIPATSAALEKCGKKLPLKGSYSIMWFVTTKRSKKSENKIKALEGSPQWWSERCYKGGTWTQMGSPSRKIIYTVLKTFNIKMKVPNSLFQNWWKIWPVSEWDRQYWNSNMERREWT